MGQEIGRAGQCRRAVLIGLPLRQRRRGLDKDMDEALRWWRKAAEQGIQDAYCRIGECYGEGNGVLRNAYTAVEYFKKAADKGHSYAQYSLASVYLLMGLTEEAAKYFEKAAEQGNAEAQFNLARMYYFGNGVKQDYAETVKWLEKAAEYDYWPAVYALGYCYILGKACRRVSITEYTRCRRLPRTGLKPRRCLWRTISM